MASEQVQMVEHKARHDLVHVGSRSADPRSDFREGRTPLLLSSIYYHDGPPSLPGLGPEGEREEERRRRGRRFQMVASSILEKVLNFIDRILAAVNRNKWTLSYLIVMTTLAVALQLLHYAAK